MICLSVIFLITAEAADVTFLTRLNCLIIDNVIKCEKKQQPETSGP